MTKHRDLAYGQALPEAVMDAMMELLGTYISSNFTVTQVNATTLRIPASAGNGQVSASIGGAWRYNVANADAVAPAGSAATYSLWITGSANNFAPGPPEVDNTVYAFGLEVRASGSPAAALSRQIGTVDWTGTAIRSVSLTVASAGDDRYPGEFVQSAGATLFPNCLLCDGSPVSRATYARLFAAIGTTWGPGDGSTTFNVPDMRGKGLIGSGTGTGLTARALGPSPGGAADGVETVALAIANMPAHDHGATTGNASPTGTIGNTTATGTVAANTATGTVAGAGATGTIGNHTGHSHNNNFADGTSFVDLANGFITMARGSTGGVSPSRFSYENTAGAGAITGDYTGPTIPVQGHGDTGGAHTHAFTPTTHAHGFTGDPHAHGLTIDAHAHTFTGSSHAHSVTPQGSGTAHQNMAPWAAGTWMVHI